MKRKIRQTLTSTIQRVRNWTRETKQGLSPQNISKWVDNRVGFTNTMLKPAPSYSLNPFYWLGALAIMAFGLQAVTGVLMLLYYVPTPTQAYSTTISIIQTVPFGGLIETIHVYGAYAMILLAFLHLMRGYFASVHKRPRELMWVLGMLMGLTTLLMGLTGYLLPWTVVSYSATDVSLAMITLLPKPIANIVTFIAAGNSGDASELTHFFYLHVLVLPAVLLLLFFAKMYMFETHGASEPPSGIKEEVKYHSWFPSVFLYLVMIGGVFLGLLLAASAIFPISLPPEYSVAAAQTSIPQPDWYFLAVYQLLKLGFFAGKNEVDAMGIVTFGLILAVVLPFIDRNRRRDPRQRPVFVTVGVVFIVELLFLTVWGHLTPGQTIPIPEAAAGLLLPALITIGGIWLIWWRRRPAAGTTPIVAQPGGILASMMGTPFKAPALTVVFVLLLIGGSLSFSSFVGSLSAMQTQASVLVVSLTAVLACFAAMSMIVKRLVQISEVAKRS